MATENKNLIRSFLITVGALVLSIAVSVLLHISMNTQIEQIQEHRADEAAFLQAEDVASSIRQVLGRSMDVPEQLDSLLPPLTAAASVEKDLTARITRFFARVPEVEVGGVASHPQNDDVQTISFTIRGRMRIDNFDRVLQEISEFPVLLEVDSATIDIGAIASPLEGESTFRGRVFSSF